MFVEEYYDIVFDPFWICLGITILAFIVAGVLYLTNIKKCDAPDVSTTTYPLICAKDDSSIEGSISGGILYVQGSASEESVYKCYYQLEDGGIKQCTIPANFTTIYFVESSAEVRLEQIIITEYYLNHNNTPATRWQATSKTTYKLYVPEGSVINVYKFDSE